MKLLILCFLVINLIYCHQNNFDISVDLPENFTFYNFRLLDTQNQSNSEIQACSESAYINNTQDRQKFLNDIYIIEPVKEFFIIFGIFTFFSELFVIITFLRYKEVRKQPGDLLFAISCSELLLTIHWMIQSGYEIKYSTVASDSNFCQFNSAISLMAGTAEYLYNCCFCIWLITKIKSILRPFQIKSIYYHIFCITGSITFTIYIFVSNQAGKSLFGTCSIVAVSKIPYLGIVPLILFIILGLSSMIYFQKNVPNDEKFKQNKDGFLYYYQRYVYACLVIWTCLAISNVVVISQCQNYKNSKAVDVFITIGNLSKLMTSMSLSVLRYTDPYIRPKVNRYLRMIKNKIMRKNTNNKDLEAQLVLGQNSIQKKVQQNLEESITESQDIKISNHNIFNSLQQDMRIKFVYTMLAGIIFNHKRYEQHESKIQEIIKSGLFLDHHNKDEEKLFENVEIHINDQQIFGKLPLFKQYFDEQNYNRGVYDSKMTIYAAQMFDEIFFDDKDLLDLEKSLNLAENVEQIKKASQADGGKGGEFFLFTYDNKIIIKTMSIQDLNEFLRIKKDYYNYLMENKDTMISKYYGIFKFESLQQDNENFESQYIVMMRDIAGCQKEAKYRTFDMKGSEFQREVLKGNQDIDPAQKVLKDQDFKKLEQKLFIEEEKKQVLVNILTRDSNFFRKMKLMDYSLLVIMVNREKQLELILEKSISNQQREYKYIENLNKSVNIFRSTSNSNIYYHFAIIDYLQPYNTQKMVEKNIKKIINLNYNLDTSSQDPDFYSTRFIQFIQSIIL